MKKRKFILLLLIFFIVPVKATTIVNYKNSTDLCNSVKNGIFKVGVSGYYSGQSRNITPLTNSCKVSKRIVGRTTSTHEIYIDDTLVKKSGSYGSYAYLYLNNKKLAVGETVYFTINIENKNIMGNTYKDLRLMFKASGGDVIEKYNSISYYVTTNKKTYGPFKMVENNYNNIYNEKDSNGKSTKYTVYDIVSDNLVKGIPKSEKIKTIKVVPYENYPVNTGYFKLFNLSLEGYTSSYSNGKMITLKNAEDSIRHNIVNNMIRFENGVVYSGKVG